MLSIPQRIGAFVLVTFVIYSIIAMKMGDSFEKKHVNGALFTASIISASLIMLIP